jgi:hypothetical protein
VLKRLIIAIALVAVAAVAAIVAAGHIIGGGSSMAACEKVLGPASANTAPEYAIHDALLSPACKGLTQKQQVNAWDIVLGLPEEYRDVN